jgi:hypothetical protein
VVDPIAGQAVLKDLVLKAAAAVHRVLFHQEALLAAQEVSEVCS